MRRKIKSLPVGSEANELERKIFEAIHEACQSDLIELDRALARPELICAGQFGAPSDFVVFAAVQIVNKHWEVVSDDLKERLRDQKDNREQSAKAYERISRKLHASAPQPIAEIERSEAIAKMMRDAGVGIGRILRKYKGDKRHTPRQGVALLLKAICEYKRDFESWPALAHVLETAFEVADIDTTHMTAGALKLAAKRYRNEVTQ